ncbi:hypothetical protein JW879_04795 [candidate division WOR-3 bacterium]|nr:hypothetical protein [candidate division WOR-3 bacterium]
MKKSLILIILMFTLIFISCGGEAIFAGKAYRLKAEAALKEIRNALAKYVIKNGQYPSEMEWEKVLEPYFRTEINPDPEWITRRKMFVMRAKTKITQCEGIVKEIKKDLFFADSSLVENITKYLYPIDSALTFASYEIKEARAYDYRNIVPEMNGLMGFVSNLDVGEEKTKIINSMVRQNEELGYMVTEIENSLLQRDSLMKTDLIEEEAVESLFSHIERKLDVPLLDIQGQTSPPSADTIPLYSNEVQDQIKKITSVLDSEKDSTLIRQLKEFDDMMVSYVNGGENIDFVLSLIALKKKIPVAIELFQSFYSERDKVLNANKVLNGYSSLGNLVSMVKLYEDENDSLPEGNLYEVFKEEEAMKEMIQDLASDPYLEVLDNGYRLTSEALDQDRTKLVMEVGFINDYKKLVRESFSEEGGPFYETNDEGLTYFVWVRAKDVENTILATIPKFTAKED